MSDYIIDIVPYGGRKGGEVTFVGTVSDMIANSNCITAKFLRDSIVVIQKGKDNIMKEQELWQAYTHEKPAYKNEQYEAWCYGSDDPDLLLQLTLSGIKTATASAYPFYEYENCNLPKVGDHNIILKTDGSGVSI